VSVLCGREWPLDYSDVILGVEDDTALKCDIADCNGGDLDSINKAWDDLVETKDFSRWEWSLYDYEAAEGPADIEDVMQIFGPGVSIPMASTEMVWTNMAYISLESIKFGIWTMMRW
jgi:hypothetical protein